MSSSKADRRAADSLSWRASPNCCPVKTTCTTKKFLRIVLAAGLAALPGLSCAGCLIVPIRVNTVTKGAFTDTHKKVSLDFIEKGVTMREEVVQKLAWMDTGVSEQSLFIGRWVDSRWGIFWAVGSQYNANAGFDRKWNNHNLFVEFDAGGFAKQSRIISDKQLAAELSTWAAQNLDNPLDLSTPVEVLVDRNDPNETAFTGQLLLGSDSFERRELEGKGKRNFTIPPEQIASLSLSSAFPVYGGGPDPEAICVTFHFARKTRAGQKLTVRTSLPTAVLFFKYFTQTHYAVSS